MSAAAEIRPAILADLPALPTSAKVVAEHILPVEQAADWKADFPRLPVMTARDYLAELDLSEMLGLD